MCGQSLVYFGSSVIYINGVHIHNRQNYYCAGATISYNFSFDANAVSNIADIMINIEIIMSLETGAGFDVAVAITEDVSELIDLRIEIDSVANPEATSDTRFKATSDTRLKKVRKAWGQLQQSH